MEPAKMDFDGYVRQTALRNLLRYAAARTMWCQGCSMLLDCADTTTLETPDGISVLCTGCGELRLSTYGIDPDSSSEGKADGTLGGDPFPVEFVRGAFLFGDGGHFLVRCVTAARKRTGEPLIVEVTIRATSARKAIKRARAYLVRRLHVEAHEDTVKGTVVHVEVQRWKDGGWRRVKLPTR